MFLWKQKDFCSKYHPLDTEVIRNKESPFLFLQPITPNNKKVANDFSMSLFQDGRNLCVYNNFVIDLVCNFPQYKDKIIKAKNAFKKNYLFYENSNFYIQHMYVFVLNAKSILIFVQTFTLHTFSSRLWMCWIIEAGSNIRWIKIHITFTSLFSRTFLWKILFLCMVSIQERVL